MDTIRHFAFHKLSFEFVGVYIRVAEKLASDKFVLHLLYMHMMPLRVFGNIVDVPYHLLQVRRHCVALAEKSEEVAEMHIPPQLHLVLKPAHGTNSVEEFKGLTYS